MHLLLADSFDTHANLIEEKLKLVNYFRLNLDYDSLLKTSYTFMNDCITINQNNKTISSDKITSVYVRRAFVELTLQDKDNTESSFKIWKNEWNKTLHSLYLLLREKKQLNNIKNAFRAENKFLQLEIASTLGFNIPNYIVTNDKDVILSFISQWDCCVVKPMCQEMYKTDNGYEGIYVNIIHKNEVKNNFSGVEENPIFIQRYISKKYEVRYTYVAGEVFACGIESQKSQKANIDWRRYDIPNTPHYKISVPEDIKIKVERFMNELGLEFGAIDFIVTQDDEWYFLEVNPSGQWLWIEQLTGLQISDAIVNWVIVNT